MAKIAKTNAIRILEKEKVDFEVKIYKQEDGKIDGISVAHKIGIDEKYVYKTLVAQGSSKEHYVFIIPVEKELDLKKAAIAADEKKVEMIQVKDIQKITGYIRGGCSPFGMKKKYNTFIDNEVGDLERIVVSGGRIGIQIVLAPDDLVKLLDVKITDIIK
jgi:Cys-tRNA(Pro)/Cys-tRNA(Cys) deacylase